MTTHGSLERTQDVFERVPNTPDAPSPSLPAVSDLEDLERHGLVRLTPASRRLLRAALRAAGYTKFHETLEVEAERLLRSTNMRADKLFGPAYSATIALADDPRPLSALERAASLVVGAVHLCEDVMSGALTPDHHQGEPLEMGQYPNLFSTSMWIEGGRSRLFKSRRFDQIGVVVGRRIFVMPLGDLAALRAGDVLRGLERIVEEARSAPAIADHDAPGALSSGASRTLSAAFSRMRTERTNERSLLELRDCMFVLALDLDRAPATVADVALQTHVGNVANRWYLASLQLVVFGNARAGGICAFPAYLDGNVMMRAGAEIQRRARVVDLTPATSGTRLAPPRQLTWRLRATDVRRAWRDVETIRDRQPATFESRVVGRDFFAERRLDAVACFVLALARALVRCEGELPDIVQLVTVSKYRCVPVGGAVVSTAEVRAVVAALSSGEPRARLRELIASALASQRRECRVERSRLSLRWTVEAFLRTRRGLARARSTCALAVAGAGLTALRAIPRARVILSHPEIASEVPMLGRPGVRLPYVSRFGLHYQMFQDRIMMTFMPGTGWSTSNARFVEALEAALAELVELLA